MPDAARARPRRLTDRVPDIADALLDAVLVGFALWTVAFHLATAFDWRRDFTALVWLAFVALAAEVWLLFRTRFTQPSGEIDEADHASDASEGSRDLPRALLIVAVVIGAATATYTAGVQPTGAAWWPVWAGVVSTAGIGVAVALGTRRAPPSTSLAQPEGARWPAWGVVALALGMAALSALTLRPEGDDVYVMNQALYVEAHDAPFPERDTIFADQVFRDTRPRDVPPSAIEPLIGVGGRWLPFSTPTVAYLLLAPAVSALAVLAAWRLARTLRVRWPALATAGAMAFLFLDGAENASFGNFSFARAWQGKVIAVFLLLPLVWHFALSWSRDGDRRSLVGLVAALVAAVGLSSTALAVAPAAALAVLVAGAIATRRPRRLLAASIAFVYPLTLWWIVHDAERQAPIVEPAAVVAAQPGDTDPVPGTPELPATQTVPPPDAPAPAPFEFSGDLQDLDAETLWYYVFGGGVAALLVSIVAVSLAWVVVRDRASRLALSLTSLGVFAVVYAPGAAIRLDDVTDVGAVVWRAVWATPLPLMIGLLLVAPLSARSPRIRALGGAASAAVLAALLISGSPVIDGPRVANFGRVTWDVEPVARTAAAKLTALADPGSIAAAPEKIGQALSSTTVRVRPVNPRGFEMVGSHAVAEFRSADRRLLSEATERGLDPGDAPRFGAALDALRVTLACVAASAEGPTIERVLSQRGFVLVETDGICAYWRRDPTSA